MKIKVPIKINIGLNIFNKNIDKLKHKIYSLMVKSFQIFDEIIFNVNNDIKNNEIHYYYDNNEIIIQDCLIKKSISYLDNKYNLKYKYNITIYKHIPIGSGLGGGSSDAAVVIKKICSNENININDLDWNEIALNLGSDIPFFLSEYNSGIVGNYGDKITPFKLPPNLKFTIHIINTLSSTTKVFNKFDEINKNNLCVNDYDEFVVNINNKQKINLYNDLQEPCFILQPHLVEYWKKYKNMHDYIILTGSGASIIGLDYMKG